MLDQTLDRAQGVARAAAGGRQRLAPAAMPRSWPRSWSSEYRSFPALYRPLVTARNERWLPQIEQLLKGTRIAWSSWAPCTWWVTAACWNSCAGPVYGDAAELTAATRARAVRVTVEAPQRHGQQQRPGQHQPAHETIEALSRKPSGARLRRGRRQLVGHEHHPHPAGVQSDAGGDVAGRRAHQPEHHSRQRGARETHRRSRAGCANTCSVPSSSVEPAVRGRPAAARCGSSRRNA